MLVLPSLKGTSRGVIFAGEQLGSDRLSPILRQEAVRSIEHSFRLLARLDDLACQHAAA